MTAEVMFVARVTSIQETKNGYFRFRCHLGKHTKEDDDGVYDKVMLLNFTVSDKLVNMVENLRKGAVVFVNKGLDGPSDDDGKYYGLDTWETDMNQNDDGEWSQLAGIELGFIGIRDKISVVGWGDEDADPLLEGAESDSRGRRSRDDDDDDEGKSRGRGRRGRGRGSDDDEGKATKRNSKTSRSNKRGRGRR